MATKHLAAFLVLSTLFAVPTIFYLSANPEPRFQGMTASEWEAEIQQWQPMLCFATSLPRAACRAWYERPPAPSIPDEISDWWDRLCGREPDPPGALVCSKTRHLPAGIEAAPEAVPVLLQLLQSRHVTVRCAAVEALGMIEMPEEAVRAALVDAATDDDSEVRDRVKEALERIEIYDASQK